MATLLIPTPLRKFTENQAQFKSNGTSVKEVIDDLLHSHADLKPHLLDADGNIRSFVRIYVKDEDIQVLQKEHTKVEQDTLISIIPAIAGGSY